MDLLLDRSIDGLLAGAMQHFYALTLVVVRLSGLMLVGPVFGQSMVPANVRILLVLTLAFLITPTLGRQWQQGVQRLDENRDGWITRDEVPDHLLPRFDRQRAAQGGTVAAALSLAEFDAAPPMPRSLLDYAWTAAGELSLGFVLGLGIHILLSGLQLAGDLIDQQSGTSLGAVFNPELDMEGSMTGQLLYLLGTAALLCLEPLGGHLMMVSALVETFQTLPVGEAFLSRPVVDLLRDLVHQSLVLGVQVAAPLLATMSLLALTMGFLGHTVPQINVLVIGFPVRVLVGTLVLTLCLSGAAHAVVDLVPAVIDRLQTALIPL